MKKKLSISLLIVCLLVTQNASACCWCCCGWPCRDKQQTQEQARPLITKLRLAEMRRTPSIIDKHQALELLARLHELKAENSDALSQLYQKTQWGQYSIHADYREPLRSLGFLNNTNFDFSDAATRLLVTFALYEDIYNNNQLSVHTQEEFLALDDVQEVRE